MEDDEEIQSHPSAGSGSPASTRSNGRITVTVAAAPPSQAALPMALPIQQHQQSRPSGNSGGGGSGSGGGGGGGGREDCWSEGATAILIDAWGERYLELSRGNLKQKHWKDVADIVSSREDYNKAPKTDIQCKNRIDTVKKKYKQEKAKIAAGAGPSKWPFFDRLDQLIGATSKSNSAGTAAAPSGAIVPFSGSQRGVPMGIPVTVRSAPQLRQQKQKVQQLRKRPPADSDEEDSEPEPSPDSPDDLPPSTYDRKRTRIHRELMNMPRVTPSAKSRGRDRDRDRDGGGREKAWGNSVRELTRAILKFGEAYEQAESSKLQQLVDMEKQRMKFARELELQRMQFFMKTQVELSQFKHRKVGNSNNHHNSSNNTAANNNSDSSN